jgi:hypothetical protein
MDAVLFPFVFSDVQFFARSCGLLLSPDTDRPISECPFIQWIAFTVTIVTEANSIPFFLPGKGPEKIFPGPWGCLPESRKGNPATGHFF